MFPKKSLGQNFLVDGNLQRAIVEALSIGKSDIVLEIGPGTGALTKHLLEKSAHLMLVELDDQLVGELQVAYEARQNVEIIHSDFLKLDLPELIDDYSKLVVVGNIPYNITAPIIFKLMTHPRPREVVLLVQKEVADRLTAKVGTSEYGAMSVGLRAVAQVKKVLNVPRTAFKPVPRVDSTLVKILPHYPPLISPRVEKHLRIITRSFFQWRRKQIQKIMRDHPDLNFTKNTLEEIALDTGWDLSRRPETLAPSDFTKLASMVAKFLGE